MPENAETKNGRRINVVGYACGRKRSGKSTLLARYASRFPRRIIWDMACEFDGVYPNAVEAFTYDETIDALSDVADKPEWIVVTSIPPDDFVRLCNVLAPVTDARGGYSRHVGGVLLECGEIDTVAPNNAGIDSAVSNVFLRGRHYLVSVLCASLRPSSVHKLVTSQADIVSFFRQHEARDVEYIAAVSSEAIASAVSMLPRYHHVEYLPAFGIAREIDPEGKELKVISR